jgi:hypothetical protein
MNSIPHDSPPPYNGPFSLTALPVRFAKKRYRVTCSECRTAFSSTPSILMLSGENVAHAHCPCCKTKLHLEIADEMRGSYMVCEPHATSEHRLRFERALGDPPPWLQSA